MSHKKELHKQSMLNN